MLAVHIINSPTLAYKYTLGIIFLCTKNKGFKVTTCQQEFPGAGENGIDWKLLSCIYIDHNFNTALFFKYCQRGLTGHYSFFISLFLKFQGEFRFPQALIVLPKQMCHSSDVFVKSCWYFQFLTHHFLFVVTSNFLLVRFKLSC